MDHATQQRDELRYYIHDGSDAFRFQLAGTLSMDSARDLEQAWRTASSTIGDRSTIVDLSQLTSIEATGEELLGRWHANGLRFVVGSPEAARIRKMTGQPVAILKHQADTSIWRRFRSAPVWIAAALVFLFPASAANLKSETASAWEDYLRDVNIQTHDRAKAGRTFLWVDECPDLIAKVRRGEIVVSPAGGSSPKEVPFGLIHDWIGAAFIPDATIDRILPVVRDYGKYKDYYRPAVVTSEAIALNDSEDRFSLKIAHKSLFRKNAVDSDYTSLRFHVDDRRAYTIAQSTRIQEIAGYGTSSQHLVPENEGTGLMWRVFGVTRFEERDGGVYLETEGIVLSRDIPASLRFIIEPVVRRVAKASLVNSLEQTREAVRANHMNVAGRR